MAGNASPQFCKNGVIGTPALLATACVRSDGVTTIATDSYLLLTADATNGTLVEYVRLIPVANAAGIATNATVIRFFLSTVTAGATTTNNTHLIKEVALGIVTASSATVPLNEFDVLLGIRIPAGLTLLATTHIGAAANTWYKAIAFGGDY